jgi:hypothetical protein
MLSDIHLSIPWFAGYLASPSFPADKSGIKMKMSWSNGGMTLTGKNRRTGRKTCHSAATLSTTNLRQPRI